MRPSPSIAPAQPDDVDVYLVLDDLGGRLGRVWRESDEESTDRKTLITDLLHGQVLACFDPYWPSLKIAVARFHFGKQKAAPKDESDGGFPWC